MRSSGFTAVVVDDEPLAAEGIRRLCAASDLVEIAGEALDGPSALDLIRRVEPDAVFLDIAMPGMNGLDVAAALRSLPKPPHVVLVTANDNFATEAFDLAVIDYVLKPLFSAARSRSRSTRSDAQGEWAVLNIRYMSASHPAMRDRGVRSTALISGRPRLSGIS